MNKYFKFFILFYILNANFLFAQPGLYFRHFTIQQGLSQNTVTCIFQDSQGFIWFGTEDGLNRYNGYNVEVFKHDPSDNRTISHSNIRCLFEDKDDVLWIGTDDGLNSFDRSNEKFIHYRGASGNSISSNLISSVTQDKNGMLWIGTNNGLNSFDIKNAKWTVYRHDDHDNSSLSNNNVSCISTDRNGSLWIGTSNGGINRFDINTKKFTSYKNNPASESSLSENDVTTIYEDKGGIIWIGTVNEGLNKLDKLTGTFTRYKNNPGDINSISQNSVFSICEDAFSTLWVGTLGGGLNAFNKATEKFSSYKNDPENPGSVSNNTIWSLHLDRAGALWIGTREGVNILDKGLRRFETVAFNTGSQANSIYSIYEDREGTIWFGILGGGVVAVEKNSSSKKFYHSDPANPNSISSNNVFTISEDKEGIIWIGTYEGLNAMNKKTGYVLQYKNQPADNFSLSNNYVRAVLCDQSGIIWTGTYGGGLNSFDKSTGKFTRYKNDGSSRSLSSDIVTCLYEDHAGILWIGTYGGGLCSFDKSSKKFTAYKNNPANAASISNNFIHCIAEDKSGTLWIGTYGGGLNAFDKSKNEFSRFTEKEGLSNNVINGIVADVNGNLWLSTNKGICRFKIADTNKEQIVRTYDLQDGAQNKYNEGAFLKGKNRKIYFGGSMGYNAFNPDEIKDNPYLPPVAITRFYLFEKPHTMDTMITAKRTVILKYNQNFFSFEFAALNYTFPEKNQYAYMMEGLDEDWNYCGNRRYAAYTNIDPGEYTFRVKACNNDGIWNEQGTLLRMSITPPFWKTWWFSVLAGIFIASAIVLYIRFRTRTLTKRNILLEDKVEQRTSELKEKNDELVKTMTNLHSAQEQLVHSEKMASLGQLTAGIAHEIQNPLNFVNNFSIVSAEMLEELHHSTPQEAPLIIDDLKTNLQKIAHHGQRAERIVKGMLMHSRTASAEKQLTDINKLIEDALNLAYTSLRARDNSFKCEIKTSLGSGIPGINIVPQDVSRVILNIINNAFYSMMEKKKNTGDSVPPGYQPQLTLSTTLRNKNVVIEIKDNGTGIPKEIQDKIFQPFFTTKPPGEGTGLGLSLSFDIITKGHNGEIKVETKQNEFTEFIITLPFEETEKK